MVNNTECADTLQGLGIGAFTHQQSFRLVSQKTATLARISPMTMEAVLSR